MLNNVHRRTEKQNKQIKSHLTLNTELAELNGGITPNTHRWVKRAKARGQPYLEKRFPWQHPLVDPKRSSYPALEEFSMRCSRREEKQQEQEGVRQRSEQV